MNGTSTAARSRRPPILPKTTTPKHRRLFLKGERLQGPLSAKKMRDGKRTGWLVRRPRDAPAVRTAGYGLGVAALVLSLITVAAIRLWS
jgi:hypothetical protein